MILLRNSKDSGLQLAPELGGILPAWLYNNIVISVVQVNCNVVHVKAKRLKFTSFSGMTEETSFILLACNVSCPR